MTAALPHHRRLLAAQRLAGDPRRRRRLRHLGAMAPAPRPAPQRNGTGCSPSALSAGSIYGFRQLLQDTRDRVVDPRSRRGGGHARRRAVAAVPRRARRRPLRAASATGASTLTSAARNSQTLFIYADASGYPRPLQFELGDKIDREGLRSLAPEAVAEFERRVGLTPRRLAAKHEVGHQLDVEGDDDRGDEAGQRPSASSGAASAPSFRRSAVNSTSGTTAKGSCRLRITWLRMSSFAVPLDPHHRSSPAPPARSPPTASPAGASTRGCGN